ncbi:MAG: hypothetical protein J6P50_02790 [Bacteroidales bacterium]|nr:hypothetical protein [Bacteroidales bacterium]MBO7487329.1 hypothetical protein [Bacteroidales bacterium]
MQFAQIHGNEALKANLTGMVDGGKMGHALLFVEEQGMGAIAFALALSQYINCKDRSGGDSCGVCNSCHKHGKLIHPDVHFVFPVAATSSLAESEKKHPISDYFLDGFRQLVLTNPYFDEQDLFDAIGLENKAGNISVHEAKDIISKLSLKPYESEFKVMIIYLAEKMNAEAANKLLKLLEEPPQGTFFFLVCHKPDKLLPTILSRCQVIRLQPDTPEDICDMLCREEQADADHAMVAARASRGSYGTALKLLREEEISVEYASDIRELLDAALEHNLTKLLAIADALTTPGREKQRDFCLYAENYIRKIFMFANGVPQISFALSGEYEHLERYAASIKKDFYRKALASLDTALSAIESNVNAKLTFVDLCNRFYLYI